MKEWFQDWFDSPYYKLLYRHRDEAEAKNFIQRLLKEIDLPSEAKILDMPCGNGRHARVMADAGFDVTGGDLSERNISEAMPYSKSNLHFVNHDMRNLLHENYFDAVFNLFTSLGYFDSSDGNEQAIKSFSSSLKPNGILVIDFFNRSCLSENLKCGDNILIEEVEFTIQRKIENNKVVKQIEVKDGKEKFHFEERVQLLELSDFEKLFTLFGLVLEKTFGNYQLEPFTEKSERLILIARKK